MINVHKTTEKRFKGSKKTVILLVFPLRDKTKETSITEDFLLLTASYNAPHDKNVYGCAIVKDLIDPIFSAV